MKEIKMIGLDLDGTLLNKEKKLTKYSEKVLNQAIRQGVTVLVATGRPLSGVPDFMREFPGMRYILTANGARIYDRKEGEHLLFSHLLSNQDASEALDIFEDYDTLQDVYYDGVGYANRAELEKLEKYYPDPAMREYIRTTRKRVDSVRDKMKEYSFGMDKIQAVFADLKERKEAMKRLKETTELSVTGALFNNIEVNAKGVNKGNGLLELGHFLGISRDEIMACGDGLNDLVMLQTVGFGVAMANGNKEVMEHADYVTLTNEEDGVAKAIEKFVLR